MYHQIGHFYSFFETSESDLDQISQLIVNTITSESKAVLDIGSGPGDIALQLARRGFTITCVEPSPSMRSVFLSRLNDERSMDPKITLLPGNIETLDLKQHYPIVLVRSVLFLLKDLGQQIRALRSIQRHIGVNGKAIANFVIKRDTKFKEKKLIGRRTLGESEYLHYSQSRYEGNVKIVTWIFEMWHQGKCIESHKEDFRVLENSFEEIKCILDQTGLRMIDSYENFSGKNFSTDRSESLIAVLENKAL